MKATSQSKSAYSYWSRLLTAVTGALSILAALRVIIEDSVSALLLSLLDYYRQVILALFEPLFAWFSIATKSCRGSMIIAVIVPIIGILAPFGIAFWVYLIGYVTYLQFWVISWPFRKLLGAMGLSVPKVPVESAQLLLQRFKHTMRERFPVRRNPDSSASAETPDPTNELFPESIMWRYLVGVAQGSLAAA